MTNRREDLSTTNSPSTTLVLHCGMEFFSLAEFSMSQEEKFRLVRVETLPLSFKKISSQEIRTQFQKIESSWKLRDAPLHCLLPADAVFLQKATLEIPLNIYRSIFCIIDLEAEQLIPWPLDEVVWGYQLLKKSQNESSEIIEIIYAAIKKQPLESLCEALEETGFIIQSINAPPLTLMNIKNDPTFKNNNPLASTLHEALKAIEQIPPGINLLPPSLIAKRKQHQRLPYFVAATVLLFFGLLACSLFLNQATQNNLAANAQSTLLLDQEKRQNDVLNKNLTTADIFKKNNEQLTRLIEKRKAWLSLVHELQHSLPHRYLWITKLSPSAEKKNHSSSEAITAITLEGLYLENPDQAEIVDAFANKLKKSPLFAIHKTNREKIITLRTIPDGKSYAYRFTLFLPLSKPIE